MLFIIYTNVIWKYLRHNCFALYANFSEFTFKAFRMPQNIYCEFGKLHVNIQMIKFWTIVVA